MSSSVPPTSTATIRSTNAMVCSIDHVASAAGLAMMRNGGTAVDAAVATNAVLTVTSQHMCGLGGDLFALVHVNGQPVACLNASGRAGSGLEAATLRQAGHTTMPFKRALASVTVPGVVDGWFALHQRFGVLPFADVLAPAIELATHGFAAAPLLAYSVRSIADVEGAEDFLSNRPLQTGSVVRRPGVARSLSAIAADGRDGFYAGEFGRGLVALGGGQFDQSDLDLVHADWVDPLTTTVWGHEVSTVPPNSQGYLTLQAARIAEMLNLPTDTTDPQFAHLLIEAARQAAWDRPAVLHELADGNALLDDDRIAGRAQNIRPDQAATLPDTYRKAGTIHLCAVDKNRMGVSLIQSVASSFGSEIVVPGTGIFLHNRGTGFSLTANHPAELAPGRRPPHTLAPALIRTPAGELHTVLGTMGGDSQPQIVLQMLARLLVAHESPGTIITSPRWTLKSPGATGFDTWTTKNSPIVTLETHSPSSWALELEAIGHHVTSADGGHGHAHLIHVAGGILAGATDPRALTGGVAAH